MGARKSDGDKQPMSRHVVNGVPMDSAKWRRLLEWCDAQGKRIGVVASELFEELIERKGI